MLDKARFIVAIQPKGHPDQLLACKLLAQLLLRRFEETQVETFRDEWYGASADIQLLSPVEARAPAALAQTLCGALKRRYDAVGHVWMLERATELARAWLVQSPEPGPDRAAWCTLLALYRVEYGTRMGDDAALDEAVALGREVLLLRPAGHPERAVPCVNLASALKSSFDRTGDDALLDEAVQLQREVLRLQPVGHPQHANSCANMAVILRTLYARKRDDKLIEEAIAKARTSLELRPDGHADRSFSCAILSTLLKMRFSKLSDNALLMEAVVLDREVLRLRPLGHPDRGPACTNLAISLNAFLAEETGALDECAGLHEEALSLLHMQDSNRWRNHMCLAMLHADSRYHERNVRVLAHHLGQALASGTGNPVEILGTAASVLRQTLAFDMTDDVKHAVLQCYSAAIDLAMLVTGFVLEHATQLRYMADCKTLGTGAYALAADAGDLGLGLQLLERARGVVWAQRLHLRQPQLEGVPPQLSAELEGLLRQLGADGADSGGGLVPNDMMRDLRRQQHRRVQALIREVRDLPGMNEFMRGPSLVALRTTAHRHPVVVLLAHEQTCRALVLRSAEAPLTEIALPDMTLDLVASWTPDTASKQMRGDERIGLNVSSRTTSEGAHGKMLARLWTAIVRPVLMHLGLLPAPEDPAKRPRIHWCPTGALSFVPLHAAGIYTDVGAECAADFVVSSYVPTLAALHRAQQAVRPMSAHSAALALVAAERPRDARLPTLHSVRDEIASVTAVAAAHGLAVHLAAPAATVADMRAALARAAVVHVACHGMQDRAAPLASAFALADGKLPVGTLASARADGAFLAFLSACETARGDRAQPDEAVHLVATLLAVGFTNVVGTMWAMNDADGPRVARHFYARLLENDTMDEGSVAYALDSAIAELRRSGVPPSRWATFIHMGA